MELALFRVNAESFEIERCVILDPVVEGTAIADGYYAAPYFQETDGGTLFNVVTYRREQGRSNPDIVRLEFAWDEVR
jgi:hypothetical protein